MDVIGVVGVVVSMPESSSLFKCVLVESHVSSDDDECCIGSENAFFAGLCMLTSIPSGKTKN